MEPFKVKIAPRQENKSNAAFSFTALQGECTLRVLLTVREFYKLVHRLPVFIEETDMNGIDRKLAAPANGVTEGGIAKL